MPGYSIHPSVTDPDYPAAMPSIQLVNVTKQWADTRALDSIDLAIEPRTFCVLLGPSGCGKSTTLRIIAGLESAAGRSAARSPP